MRVQVWANTDALEKYMANAKRDLIGAYYRDRYTRVYDRKQPDNPEWNVNKNDICEAKDIADLFTWFKH